MTSLSAVLLLTVQLAGAEPAAPGAQAQVGQGAPQAMLAQASAPGYVLLDDSCPWGESERGFLQSDAAFPRFIGPISNPILSKDPRSLTEARALFINNVIDPQSALGGGNFQVYALQLRFALTERLTLIADKDGYAAINPAGGPTSQGWLNINAGLKYALIRDVENQFLLSAGFMYEPQTGEAAVLQSHGDGLFTFFTTAGKEIDCHTHALATFGYQLPVDGTDNSSFIYTSLHLDRQIAGWLYPLIECNWFHWVSSGNRGIPAAVGEGDGLINIGTSGVAGNNLVTLAVGLKALLTDSTELGVAWEFPISNRHDLLNNRLTADFILRY